MLSCVVGYIMPLSSNNSFSVHNPRCMDLPPWFAEGTNVVVAYRGRFKRTSGFSTSDIRTLTVLCGDRHGLPDASFPSTAHYV